MRPPLRLGVIALTRLLPESRQNVLLGRLDRLPEYDFTRSITIQFAVAFSNVRAGGKEFTVGAQHVGNLVVGILGLQGWKLESPSLRVELKHGVAEMVRLAVAAHFGAVVGAE